MKSFEILEKCQYERNGIRYKWWKFDIFNFGKMTNEQEENQAKIIESFTLDTSKDIEHLYKRFDWSWNWYLLNSD